MIILIGPQVTDDEDGELDELAGLLGAHRMCGPDVDWASVTKFVCLPGWEKCPVAVADIDMAKVFGLPVEQLQV